MAILRLDDSIGALLNLQNELQRFLRNPAFSEGFSGPGVYPAVNIFDSNGGAMVVAEMPGVEPEQINVNGKSQTLTISGSRTLKVNGEGRGYHRRELNEGQFSRSLQIPEDYDVSQAQARYENGLLMVMVPRSEQARERRISVKTA